MIHFAFFFFIVTALSGVWMRLFMLSDRTHAIPYPHLLHGHSHMAILGWTFLAVFVLYLKMNWEQIRNQKQAIAICYAILFVTSIMFLAFLYQGYALYSIILSTVHIAVEYWVIIFVFHSLKHITAIPKESRIFIKGALLTLFISTLGPFALGAIASQGLRDSALFDMAIYFYLHFQYNGWLYLFLMGLFLFLLHKKGIKVNKKLVQISFWTYITALFPGYLLSVLWFDFGTFGVIAAIFGATGQLIGVLIMCVAIFQTRQACKQTFSSHLLLSFIFVFILLVSKSIMELGLLYVPFAELIYETRAVVIGYLHLTLLGFISMFILTLFQGIGILTESNTVKNGIAVFLAGFLINETVLFISGLFTWLQIKPIPYANETLLAASIIISLGVGIIWGTLFKQTKAAPYTRTKAV